MVRRRAADPKLCTLALVSCLIAAVHHHGVMGGRASEQGALVDVARFVVRVAARVHYQRATVCRQLKAEQIKVTVIAGP